MILPVISWKVKVQFRSSTQLKVKLSGPQDGICSYSLKFGWWTVQIPVSGRRPTPSKSRHGARLYASHIGYIIQLKSHGVTNTLQTPECTLKLWFTVYDILHINFHIESKRFGVYTFWISRTNRSTGVHFWRWISGTFDRRHVILNTSYFILRLMRTLSDRYYGCLLFWLKIQFFSSLILFKIKVWRQNWWNLNAWAVLNHGQSSIECLMLDSKSEKIGHALIFKKCIKLRKI